MRTDWIDKDDMSCVLRLLTSQNRLVVETCLQTGLRVSDVLSLTPADVSRQRFTVREQKTGKSRRVYISRDLQQRLIDNAGETYVFPGHIDSSRHRTRQAVWHDINRASKALRIKATVGTHTARKMAAVDYYRKHGLENTRKYLNHNDTATTIIYLLSEFIK